MDAQLRLLATGSATEPDDRAASPAIVDGRWRLDDTTRAVGRLGIARARAALQAARHAEHDDDAAAA